MTGWQALTPHIALGGSCWIGGFMLGRLEGVLGAGRTRRERWEMLGRLVLAAVVIALAVVLVVATKQQAADQTRRSDCYLAYFAQVSGSLADRSAATGQASAAQVAFLTAGRDGTIGADDYDRYLTSLADLERARQASPIPQPPDCR